MIYIKFTYLYYKTCAKLFFDTDQLFKYTVRSLYRTFYAKKVIAIAAN